MSDELEAQIEAERKEIERAPKIPVRVFQPVTAGMAGRCGWCGRYCNDLVMVEVFHGIERYKGVECCGARHTG